MSSNKRTAEGSPAFRQCRVLRSAFYQKDGFGGLWQCACSPQCRRHCGERWHSRILAACVGFVLSLWQRVGVSALFCEGSFFLFFNTPQYFVKFFDLCFLLNLLKFQRWSNYFHAVFKRNFSPLFWCWFEIRVAK
jgi:hypothetical protein